MHVSINRYIQTYIHEYKLPFIQLCMHTYIYPYIHIYKKTRTYIISHITHIHVPSYIHTFIQKQSKRKING